MPRYSFDWEFPPYTNSENSLPATEEEAREHFNKLIDETWERWFEKPCLSFPAREGFDFEE